ncbi:MAG: glutamate racemase [Polyangiales bacterium]
MTAIGVFDSGLGGLTVAHAIREALPDEDLVYLGDTARVPYGTRSADTVIRYARACAQHLVKHRIKLLVVACNTVSAVALEMLRDELDVPVLGVIEPGARAGAAASRKKRIGVLATQGTVNSRAYERALHAVDSRIEVFALAAPLLVPLAEEGWLDGEVPRLVVERYLTPLTQKDIDALVLGCTHYPLLGGVIRAEAARLAGPELVVVDSAQATAHELAHLLETKGLREPRSGRGKLRLMVTDLPGRFAEVASRFLQEELEGLDVEQVDL